MMGTYSGGGGEKLIRRLELNGGFTILIKEPLFNQVASLMTEQTS